MENIEEIKDYIAKGIQSYHWSDEFLVKDLAKRGIDQHEAESLIAQVKQERKVSNKDSIFNDDVSETGGITGGLQVICWFIGGGGLLTFLLSWVRYSDAQYNRTIFNTMDLVSGGLYALLTLYAVVQMFRVKPNAVFLMKSLLIMLFLSNTLSLVEGWSLSGMDGYFFNPIAVVGRIFIAVFLYIYLVRSQQVKILFPPKDRHAKFYDWLIIFSPFVVDILVFVMVILIIIGKNVNG